MEQSEGEAGPIAVFGGTGHYGQQVVRSLLRRGEPVRVLSRSAERAQAALGAEVEVVEGDVVDPAVVARTLDGARAVVIAVAAMTAKLIRRRTDIERDAVLEILRQADAAGIDRIVYLSVYEIDEDFLRENRIEDAAANHRVVEKALRDGDANWTIIGCSPSFEFFWMFVEKGAAPGAGTHPNPTMAPEDVGEIAAQSVLRDDLARRRFRMAGAEPMTFVEAARRVSLVTGEEIKLQQIPIPLVRAVAFLSRPFTPFLRFIYVGMTLHDRFPQHLVDQIAADHATLLDVFDLEPMTFDAAARRRFGPKDD